MGSFVFGYANNAIAGSFVQTSFVAKFLSGSNAESVIGGILGAYVFHQTNPRTFRLEGLIKCVTDS